MPFLVIGGLLRQNGPSGKVRTVCLNAKWFGVIGENKDQSGGVMIFFLSILTTITNPQLCIAVAMHALVMDFI